MDDPSLVLREGISPIVMAVPNIPPFTTPSLTANFVIRIVLAIIANLVCLVPLRLLYRNGEFAAVVFITVVEIKNIFTIVTAALWHTDDMEAWWPGYGLCDIEQFVYNGCAGIYVTCLLAIMRNLAHQVGVMRAHPLTVREKRRRNFIQALIIFPLPIVQLAFTWPLAAQRYAVGTLMGCAWVPSSTWPYLVFFIIAQLVVSVVAGIYAVITFFRFRQVAKATSSALASSRAAFLRSQRTKRRLYLMVTSILVPFLPITITLCFLNVQALGALRPFNFNEIHHPKTSLPWETIIFIPSRFNDFGSLNNGYISIFTAVPIFLFFGMTKDAINSYRIVVLYFGLGKIWPNLHNEYDPDRSATQTASSSGFLTRVTGRTKPSQSPSECKRGSHPMSKSISSNESTSSHNLTRMLTPRLATSLGGDAPVSSLASSWTDRLPRNPFPFRTKTEVVYLGSSIPSRPPVLPPLAQASVFSLQSRNDDEIHEQTVPPQHQTSPPRSRNFSLPVVARGQPHPSETLDLPGAFSTLESSSRCAELADNRPPPDIIDYHQRP
ncbi:a-pheromone receptor PreA [Beauveria brongniartii RCEF 3172]|uniref:A-pheromone receptor PreA n=1 Tax=Beauveria brongniartii RCEF 3172 TaxID=1081107 RepID=A0A167HP40_9HYPO|nr:a-pheromone receptor PreA [Beauveria brongniartii RCEF 3172]